MARSKLTPDEAKEYSNSLAKAAAGDYELMDFAINTLGVPQALGMEPSDWVDSIGGYIRMTIEDRREAVGELLAEGRSQTQVATILGISKQTIIRDKSMIEAQRTVPAGTAQAQIGAGTKPAGTPAQIRNLLEQGKKAAEIATLLGIGIRKVEMEQAALRKERRTAEKTARRSGSKPAALTQGEAHAMLEGRLASIELGALNLAAWWRQHGKEALADSDLGWVDETIAHTKEKVSMILDSVRGVDADADKALAKWAEEAEGKEAE